MENNYLEKKSNLYLIKI